MERIPPLIPPAFAVALSNKVVLPPLGGYDCLEAKSCTADCYI